MKILGFGSRAGVSPAVLSEAMWAIVEECGIPYTFIHGDCRGVDRQLAGWFAERFSCEITAVPANWSLYGRSAGPLRNQVMVDMLDPDCDIAVGFLTASSVGSLDTIRRCQAAGVTVVYWVL